MVFVLQSEPGGHPGSKRAPDCQGYGFCEPSARENIFYRQVLHVFVWEDSWKQRSVDNWKEPLGRILIVERLIR